MKYTYDQTRVDHMDIAVTINEWVKKDWELVSIVGGSNNGGISKCVIIFRKVVA